MVHKRKKIIQFSRLFSPHVGGVEKHVYNLSQELLKKGHSVTVVTEQFDKKLKPKETIDGIEVIRIPISKEGFLKKLDIWKWVFQNRQLLKGNVVLHTHDVFFWVFPFKILFPKVKIYTTFHGYEDYPIRMRWIFARKLWEVYAAGNICIGAFMEKWYKTVPTFVSHGAVGKISSLKGAAKPADALFYGRLDEQTNVLQYVNAYMKLKKKYPRFSMRVIGEGKYLKRIEKKIKVGRATPHADAYLHRTHFVFTSRYLSIFEALKAKRLVIAYYDNPVKEDYLRLAPFADFIEIVNSEKQIMERIEFYINNPNAEKEKIAKGYEWVKQQTWKELTGVYLQLWQEEKAKAQ